jgi:TRAP-type C4-dicarboxylate transport system permease small subunit
VAIDTRIAVLGLSLSSALLLACAGVLVKAGWRYSDPRQVETTVVPIYTSSPLFVLPLSALFLRDVERVTLCKVLGAVAVGLGVAPVSLY